jgi:hypothetical protein
MFPASRELIVHIHKALLNAQFYSQVLPTAVGSELEDLFGAMICEMSAREENSESNKGGHNQGSGECDNGSNSSDSDSKDGQGTRLRRWNSEPIVSLSRLERCPSPMQPRDGTCR